MIRRYCDDRHRLVNATNTTRPPSRITCAGHCAAVFSGVVPAAPALGTWQYQHGEPGQRGNIPWGRSRHAGYCGALLYWTTSTPLGNPVCLCRNVQVVEPPGAPARLVRRHWAGPSSDRTRLSLHPERRQRFALPTRDTPIARILVTFQAAGLARRTSDQQPEHRIDGEPRPVAEPGDGTSRRRSCGPVLRIRGIPNSPQHRASVGVLRLQQIACQPSCRTGRRHCAVPRPTGRVWGSEPLRPLTLETARIPGRSLPVPHLTL